MHRIASALDSAHSIQSAIRSWSLAESNRKHRSQLMRRSQDPKQDYKTSWIQRSTVCSVSSNFRLERLTPRQQLGTPSNLNHRMLMIARGLKQLDQMQLTCRNGDERLPNHCASIRYSHQSLWMVWLKVSDSSTRFDLDSMLLHNKRPSRSLHQMSLLSGHHSTDTCEEQTEDSIFA